MAKSATTAAAVNKVCRTCNCDVGFSKRFKDAQGHYYCESCWTKLTRRAQNLSGNTQIRLLPRATCPHCWHVFAPEESLWIAEHSELVGDPVVGSAAAIRFLPSRFNVQGQAIDAYGMACQTLACPRCHLHLPRVVLESEPLFISIIGGPSSGKSNLLAAMGWKLREALARQFGVVFGDADTVSNRLLNGYEEQLFLAADPDAPTYIAKTEEQGTIYDNVLVAGQSTALTRPFLFSIRAASRAAKPGVAAAPSRILCLYDNAGESYLPGSDDSTRPYTQHLGKAQALIFILDPTQDPRFKKRCQALSADPQLTSDRRVYRQEIFLHEAALRIRRYAGLAPNARYERPLIVAVSKSDIWSSLIDEDTTTDPYVPLAAGGVESGLHAVDTARVERVSRKVRQILLEITPEVVAAAEGVSNHIIYVPVSALGHAPQPLAGSPNLLAIRPRDVAPRWATVPILYALAKWTTGLVRPVP